MHFHRWNGWSLPVENNAGLLVQVTACKKCGKVKHRSMPKIGVTADKIEAALHAVKGKDHAKDGKDNQQHHEPDSQ